MHLPGGEQNRTLQLASELHAQGQLADAEKLYRQVLSADRRNPDALHLLGVLLHQTGRTVDGTKSIRRAIDICPRVAQYRENLANIYREISDPAALAECLRDIAALNHRAIAPRLRLARVLQVELHRPNDAIEIFREILSIDPVHGEALAGLASALHQTGDLPGALECYDRAVSLCPEDSELFSNFAIALSEHGELDRAAEILGRAVGLHPRNAVLWYNLGVVHTARRSNQEAIDAYQKAIEIDPNYTQAYLNLGRVAYRQGQLEDSAKFFLKLAQNHPNSAAAHNNLGLIRLWQGRQDQAIKSMREALRIDPDSEQAWDNVLMAMLYQGDDDPARLFEEHRAWGRRHEGRYLRLDYGNDPSPERRLRIGYISPDFRDHSIRFFIEPVLAHHDAAQVEIFCYASQPIADEITRGLQQHAHHWCDIYRISDDAAAELIHRDQIDILIDLALHSNANRLPVLARKPAPIQGSWLGYAAASGLEAIDFRITDAWIDPVSESGAFQLESLIRLPNTQWTYRPPPAVPDVSPLPAESRGQITFGAAINLAKLNVATIEMWSGVLLRMPSSTLVLKATNLSDAPTRQYFIDLFARCGIDQSRVILENSSPLHEYLHWFAGVDIILDTFPFSGGTTTCHALYMGVPVVTRAGNLPVSRVGSSILHNVGLAELVAQTSEQFAEIAVALAYDRPRLVEVRRTLRERMRHSPLMDEPQFVRNLESAYREQWRAWCAGRRK